MEIIHGPIPDQGEFHNVKFFLRTEECSDPVLFTESPLVGDQHMENLFGPVNGVRTEVEKSFGVTSGMQLEIVYEHDPEFYQGLHPEQGLDSDTITTRLACRTIRPAQGYPVLYWFDNRVVRHEIFGSTAIQKAAGLMFFVTAGGMNHYLASRDDNPELKKTGVQLNDKCDCSFTYSSIDDVIAQLEHIKKEFPEYEISFSGYDEHVGEIEVVGQRLETLIEAYNRADEERYHAARLKEKERQNYERLKAKFEG